MDNNEHALHIMHQGTREQLVGSATGGGGGRGNKGRRRGANKSELRKFKIVKLGEGIVFIMSSEGCSDFHWPNVLLSMFTSFLGDSTHALTEARH